MPDVKDKILLEKDGPLARIVINNPEKRNAISFEMWRALGQAAADAAADSAIRVVVIMGAGGRAFAAGADISQFEDRRGSPGDVADYNTAVDAATTAIATLSVPTIARIEGYCIGGGLGLALCCDIRIASDDARLGIPAGRLGLGYRFEMVQQLVHLVGPSHAKEILFTARQFSAAEARAMALVNQVSPRDSLFAVQDDMVERIATNAPLTLRAVKQAVTEALKDPDARDLALCRRLENACFESADYVEGRRAFMEKRKPRFVGR